MNDIIDEQEARIERIMLGLLVVCTCLLILHVLDSGRIDRLEAKMS